MRTDKTRVLAAERQEPYTAAEQAEASGHGDEWARDVPRTCICVWHFNRRHRQYRRAAEVAGCPWHTEAEVIRRADQLPATPGPLAERTA
jgi:hypothetical protein